MRLVGQNQESPSATVGHITTADNMSMTKFLGAFRWKGWEHPVPPVYIARTRFPWVLYARKLRNK